MPEEPRYTEAQWRTKLVHDDCAADGHRVANYVYSGRNKTVVGYCECCEVTWVRQDAQPARCTEVGRQGQQCLREAGHDGEHTGELRVPADG